MDELKLGRAGLIICYRTRIIKLIVSDAETTNRIIKKIQEEGTCWCGGTIWKGRGLATRFLYPDMRWDYR
jgi:hypothetical protein